LLHFEAFFHLSYDIDLFVFHFVYTNEKVVLAASICTRGGKAILSRQFRDLHKDRVTALLANFPKLTHSGTQHTTVEDENVRYVYQPVEELYVVLITNRQSNILQDIGTLRLLAQVVSSTVRSVDEREVLSSAFELLSAFDEVVTLGYRENLSMSQITTFLEMESHEEKIQDIIERNKELEAAEERKKKAKQLEMQRREVSRRGGAPATSGGFGGGISSFSSQPSPSASLTSSKMTVQDSYYEEKPKPKASLRGKGLQLESKKTSSALDALRGESEISPLMMGSPSEESENIIGRPMKSSTSTAPATTVSDNKGIELSIVETINATLGRDGSVSSSEVTGLLKLRIGDSNMRNIKVLTMTNAAGVQYKTNPNVDKAKFLQQNVICARDASRPFPANNQEFGVLRWKIGTDKLSVPLTFNCWFSRSDPGFFDVTLEYELNPEFTEVLDNVVVTIPLVSSNAHVADPSGIWDQFDDHLEWMIPEIDANSGHTSGSFEFTAEADVEDNFFPMLVTFNVKNAHNSYGQVDISDIVSTADESISLPFEKLVSLTAEKYVIV
jgi:hypothetical protein